MGILGSLFLVFPFRIVLSFLSPTKEGFQRDFGLGRNQRVRYSSFFFFFLSSSAAVRGKKDGDREHPDDFHKIKLL